MNNNNLNQILKRNKYVKRDSLSLIKADKNRVNINAWVNFSNSVQNVGDLLSVEIIREMLKMKNIDINKHISQTRHIYGIGSQLLGFQNATIWGGGFAADVSIKKGFIFYKFLHKYYHSTDVRAIRGPLSKQNLDAIGIKCPSIYGDPALLLPLFYKPEITKNTRFL